MDNNPDLEILLAFLRGEQVIGVKPEQWGAVANLAQQHRVAPLLFWRLKTLEVTRHVPADLLDQLHSVSLETAARNLRIYHELSALFERFQRDGIKGILLKGAYLVEEVYGNVAVRPMDDVDLLVRKSDLGRVGEIMQAMDFTRPYQSRESSIEFPHMHFIYVHAKTGLIIEVHWNLVRPSYRIHVDMDALWERSRPTLVAKIPVHIMPPEDLVLHLCLHASFHKFEFGLRALCDLRETLRRFQKDVDWEGLRQRAQLWNAERCVYVNLRLTRELLHAPVPENWLNTIQPADFDPYYLTIAQELIFPGGQETQIKIPSWPRFVKFWKAGSLAQKITLVWKRLFLSPQSMALLYDVPPGSLRVWLYYPVRLKDLVKENGRAVWLLLLGDKQMLSHAEQQDRINTMMSWLLVGDYL
jgi:hypothetical protein